ncbi:MAG: right-handed parallel beta-helix repeat-containing protein [Armatimonadota bacterium]|jgi:hypothetical protein
MRVLILLSMIVIAGGLTSFATAAEHFLSPAGDDEAAGTREAPWRTLEKAADAVRAGDTVTLLPGRYPGSFAPTESGTADAPIVLRAEPRLSARLIGSGDDSIALLLDGLAHIRVEGLHVAPDPERGRWLHVRGCSNVTIEDCRMEDSGGGMPAHIEDSEQVQVRGSVFQRHTGGINMFRISGVTRLLFEGNVISRAGHSPLQFYPPNTNRFMVIRGNVFHAAWGRSFEFFHDRDVLFEHNIITHAFNSGWSGSSNAKLGFTRGIFRFNRVFRNVGGAINLYPWTTDGFLDTIRLYNNVFDDNAHYGIAARSGSELTRDLVFANNIFSRNDRHGNNRQISLAGGTPEQTRLLRNVLTAGLPGEPVVYDHGQAWPVERLESEEFVAEHGARYEGNMDVDPGYVDAAQYNHALREDSPLRDAGRFLTAAVGAGEGALLAVEDAAYFYDGFGIEGEVGDLIAVGSAEQRARVVSVDHEANTLLLDRDVRWDDGAAVSLAWSGAAPDIGAYEHGDDGRVAVQVVVEPFEARPGDEVTLRAVVHGAARPERIRWWLGDGASAEGAEVTHSYAEEYDYAIRVQVVDTAGRAHYGAGYVWVAEPVDPSAPLVHSTWGPEDDSAWRLWKSYSYPGPAAYRDVVEGGVRHGPNSRNIPAGYEMPGEGVNYRHVLAPEDGGGLPTRIHPAGWDIDRYPEVFIRYRFGEGTPVALSLKPFGQSALVVGLTPAGGTGLTKLREHVLHDDGEWHELLLDARWVREVHPEVQVLEGLYFLGSPRDAVKEGHWYDLDEVIIRPAAGE